jgi:hypothetical protein
VNDIYGRTVSPTAAQRPKLAALRRTHPGLLLLGQDDDGTIAVSVPACFRHGRVEDPRACRLSSSGRLAWR